jgi:hypothetical protein
MSRRIMIGLFVLSMVAFVRTEAHAGCAVIAGFQICASWITGSAKCLASTSDTLAVTGRCEVGGTVPPATPTPSPSAVASPPPCGPADGKSEFLPPCNIRGVISCANQAPLSRSLLSGATHPPSDDDGAPGTPPRFIKRTADVSDATFDSGFRESACDGRDCRITSELDLDPASGEAACEAQGLAGFDTFTPTTGFMKAEFCNGVACYGLIERCTTLPLVCGLPYACRLAATFELPAPTP